MESGLRLVGPLEIALHLKSLAMLRDLPAPELAVLAGQARERSFAGSARIFNVGEPVGAFHIVVSGSVRATGGEHHAQRVGPGEALGLLSLLARSQEGLDAVCEMDTLTIEIDADSLADIFEDHFAILLHQIRRLARELLAERGRMPDDVLLAPAADVELPDGELDLIPRLMLMARNMHERNVDGVIQLARQAREVRFEAGARLWQPGDPSGFAYPIVDGEVRCLLADGRSFRAGRGYPLGNLESVAGEPRWYEAVALTPVRALISRTDVFLDVLEDHFAMASGFLSGLAERTIAARAEAVSRRAQEVAPAST